MNVPKGIIFLGILIAVGLVGYFVVQAIKVDADDKRIAELEDKLDRLERSQWIGPSSGWSPAELRRLQEQTDEENQRREQRQMEARIRELEYQAEQQRIYPSPYDQLRGTTTPY